MSAYLHDLACKGPSVCVCTTLLRVRDTQAGERGSWDNDSRRYELHNVDSRTAGLDCSYQSDPAVSHPRGMSS